MRNARQFHDGLGFMTNHAMISNTFEYSLQKVNPKLTLPYWDFTIDGSSAGGAMMGEEVSSAQEYSEIFSPTWFGTHDEGDYMVRETKNARDRKRAAGVCVETLWGCARVVRVCCALDYPCLFLLPSRTNCLAGGSTGADVCGSLCCEPSGKHLLAVGLVFGCTGQQTERCCRALLACTLSQITLGMTKM